MENNSATLLDIVNNLIALQKEGDYWDFKCNYNKNIDLMFDIICMANSLSSSDDRYIIVGVSESDGIFTVTGVEKNYMTQANIIDSLRNMNFSSSIPDIYLSKIEINNSNIDVIKIKNSQNKPYFLLKDYTRDGKRISRGVIYTRNGDSNTPIDATASHHEYEALWREHFGIHLSGIDRMKALLSQTDLWEGDCEQRIFHKFFPEYHIKFSQPQAITIDGQYFSYYYHSMNTSHFFASMFYHTIEFFKISCFCCDEARVRFPGPNTGSLPFIKDSYFYFYYKDTCEWELLKYFGRGRRNPIASWEGKAAAPILVFENEYDYYDFIKFVVSNAKEYFHCSCSFEYKEQPHHYIDDKTRRKIYLMNRVYKIYKIYKKLL